MMAEHQMTPTETGHVRLRAFPSGAGTWTIYIETEERHFPGERRMGGILANSADEALDTFIALLKKAEATRHPERVRRDLWAIAAEPDRAESARW